MELTQLEFFIKVVEEGSFSKAAERVYRTQPAVSIAIRRLEEEIGAPVFERSQKAPALTELGKLVYDYAKRILSVVAPRTIRILWKPVDRDPDGVAVDQAAGAVGQPARRALDVAVPVIVHRRVLVLNDQLSR